MITDQITGLRAIHVSGAVQVSGVAVYASTGRRIRAWPARTCTRPGTSLRLTEYPGPGLSADSLIPLGVWWPPPGIPLAPGGSPHWPPNSPGAERVWLASDEWPLTDGTPDGSRSGSGRRSSISTPCILAAPRQPSPCVCDSTSRRRLARQFRARRMGYQQKMMLK